MIVMKFGGSSVGNAERIKSVIEIINNYKNKYPSIAVIFSAFQGVTDELIKISNNAVSGIDVYITELKNLEKKHSDIALSLIREKENKKTLDYIKLLFEELENILQGVFLLKELSPKSTDYILSFGERLSAFIITEALLEREINCEFLDSRILIKTDESFGNAKVDFEFTNFKIASYFKEKNNIQIITGFIASSRNNITTTLGRGGSDYSASIFGAALDAEEIIIWTDVDGVMTADPKTVKRAFSLKEMTYEEAMELSHFGAKVIHPPTMLPALQKKIPLRIKNTFNPTFEGTLIKNEVLTPEFSIKGITNIDNISLLTVQGSGMVGVAGISERIFRTLGRNNINIILITQASSEHSISFAVLPQFAIIAKESIDIEFKYEIRENQIDETIVENNLSIVAVVGENMKHTPGIAGKVFSSLGKFNINIRAIAQGSSELNISTVIERKDISKALNALHTSFFFPLEKTINILIAGIGLIGTELIKQIFENENKSFNLLNIKIIIIGIANSKNYLLKDNGIGFNNYKKEFKDYSKIGNAKNYVKDFISSHQPNSIFIDCTSSKEVSEEYNNILSAGISIVTASKIANSSNLSYYKLIRKTAREKNINFLYETNVGAALPIIKTIKDLVISGDTITKIEGILSGTLSYLFNTFDDKIPFSDIVKNAKENGYTEPDPRDDLNGLDAARKLLILAREIGMEVELKDIQVENLIPENCRNLNSVEEFFIKLKENDNYFSELFNKARNNNKVLRYIGKIENGNITVKLESIDSNHPFYNLKETESIVAIYSKRYKETPLVIKGTGAGAEVTASGVYADIIKVAESFKQ